LRQREGEWMSEWVKDYWPERSLSRDRGMSPRVVNKRLTRNGNYAVADGVNSARGNCAHWLQLRKDESRRPLRRDKHDDAARNAAVEEGVHTYSGVPAEWAAAERRQLWRRRGRLVRNRSKRFLACTAAPATRRHVPHNPHPSIPSPRPASLRVPASARIQQQKRPWKTGPSQTTSDRPASSSDWESCLIDECFLLRLLRISTASPRQDESRRGCRRYGRHPRQGNDPSVSATRSLEHRLVEFV